MARTKTSWWLPEADSRPFTDRLREAQHRMRVGNTPPAIQAFFDALEAKERQELGIWNDDRLPEGTLIDVDEDEGDGNGF